MGSLKILKYRSESGESMLQVRKESFAELVAEIFLSYRDGGWGGGGDGYCFKGLDSAACFFFSRFSFSTCSNFSACLVLCSTSLLNRDPLLMHSK